MKRYSKKSLVLKENVYSKKNVRLKEQVGSITPQDVYSTAVPNMNKVGTETYDLNNQQQQPMVVSGTFERGNQASLQQASQEMANQANALHQSNPTKSVVGKMTSVNPSANGGQTSNKSGNVEQLSEGIVFTKQEMNNFLRTL